MIVADEQGPLRHKLEKAMTINEFDCTFMKSIIITCLLFSLKRVIFIIFSSDVVFARLICDLVDVFHDFPWFQPIYQNVLETYLEVDNFYIAWLGCKYLLQFLTCYDHATLLYNSFFQKIFFYVNNGFGSVYA